MFWRFPIGTHLTKVTSTQSVHGLHFRPLRAVCGPVNFNLVIYSCDLSSSTLEDTHELAQREHSEICHWLTDKVAYPSWMLPSEC